MTKTQFFTQLFIILAVTLPRIHEKLEFYPI